jgi:hypothetical protein
MSDITSETEKMTRSQKVFVEAPEPIQRLIRQVLSEERQVRHLQNRQNIHQKILDHVRSIVR